MAFPLFTDEQRRTLLNLAQYHSALMDAEREMRQLAGGPLHWKTVSGKDYLYQILDSRGNARSLGPRSTATEQRHAAWHAARVRRNGAKAPLAEVGRLYRALRLGTVSAEAAAILREADSRGLLGTSLMVVGTNAMPAYEIEAQSRIGSGLDETQDCDLAWIAPLELSGDTHAVWDMLKAVDVTYTINTERPFQARNARAYEVELLVAPSRALSLGRKDKPVPVPLIEQEWLLQGVMVDHVVCARDGSSCRIVAPDPRWFALQKLWLSEQKKRNPLKRPKDKKQGDRLLDAIADTMPHYPLDAAFAGALPPELSPYFAQWRARQKEASSRPPKSS